jgi:L-aminopeptidase/D-esterase-like protein
VRGGAVGNSGNFEWNHAICLAGGSLYGLEAASGVAAELFARRGYATRFDKIALVSGAILNDFGARDNSVYPDKRLGRAALQAARAGVFPLGPRGAGRSASVGKWFEFTHGEPSGQGAAFRQFGATRLLAFTVVNALGAIVDRQGRVVRGNRDPHSGERRSSAEFLAQQLGGAKAPQPPQGNTTLTVIVTNHKMRGVVFTQFARQVHASLARAIQPFQTAYDGDTLYAVTTGAVDNPRLDATALALAASELAWDAVLSIVDAAGSAQH